VIWCVMLRRFRRFVCDCRGVFVLGLNSVEGLQCASASHWYAAPHPRYSISPANYSTRRSALQHKPYDVRRTSTLTGKFCEPSYPSEPPSGIDLQVQVLSHHNDRNPHSNRTRLLDIHMPRWSRLVGLSGDQSEDKAAM